MSGFLLTFFYILFKSLYFAIFGRIILSWFDPGGQTRINQVLYEITEPILGPIRRMMPNMGMFDFSPMVAIMLLVFLERLVMGAMR